METSERIFRVLNHTASPAEQQQLQQWVNADPQHAQVYENIRLLWQHTLTTDHAHTVSLDFQIVQKKIQAHQRTKKIAWPLAICLLLVITITLMYLFKKDTPQHLHFHQASLAQIATTLTKQYHIQLHVPPALQHCRFTGIIYNETPEEMLTFITANLDMTLHTIGNNTFSITGASCRHLRSD